MMYEYCGYQYGYDRVNGYSCAPKTNTLEFLVFNFLRNITVKFPLTTMSLHQYK